MRRGEADGQPIIGIEYSQFARDEDERKLHTFALLHTYGMVLDVFAEFLVAEQKVVPQAWADRLHAVGRGLERRARELHDIIKNKADADAKVAADSLSGTNRALVLQPHFGSWSGFRPGVCPSRRCFRRQHYSMLLV